MIRFMGFGGYGPQLRPLRQTGCHQGIVCVASSLCVVCNLIFHHRNVIVSNRSGCHVLQVGRIDCSMELIRLCRCIMKLKMMTIAVGALLLLSAVVIIDIDPYSGESNSGNSNEEREIQYYGSNGNRFELGSNIMNKNVIRKVNGEFTWDSSKTLNIAVKPMGYMVKDVESVKYQITGTSCDIIAKHQILSFSIDKNVRTISFGFTLINDVVSGTDVNFEIKIMSGESTWWALDVSGITVKNPYNITLNQTSGGVISAEPGRALEGSIIKLTSIPDAGCIFVEWICDDVEIVDNQFTMPNKAVSISAKFLKIDYYLSCTEATGFGGNTVLDIGIKASDTAHNLDDPRLFVIAKYDDHKVLNAYCSVDLTETARIAVSSQGLVEVIVELVDGISSGLPDYCGVCQYIPSSTTG